MQVRNCVAHRSRAATSVMNEALSQVTGADATLRRGSRGVGPAGVGHYLFASTGSERRVETYHRRLSEIAEALRT